MDLDESLLVIKEDERRSSEKNQIEISNSSNTKESFTEEIATILKLAPNIAEKFEIKEKIGSGTFSSVYLAVLKDCTSKRFAIKHIIPTSRPQRIENELRCLKQFGGVDNIAEVSSCVRVKDNVFIFMPFFPHDKFQDYVDNLSLSEIQIYMRLLLSALKRLHAGNFIHRDIKPGNCLFNRLEKRLCLVDFGLAQKVDVKKMNVDNDSLLNLCELKCLTFDEDKLKYNQQNIDNKLYEDNNILDLNTLCINNIDMNTIDVNNKLMPKIDSKVINSKNDPFEIDSKSKMDVENNNLLKLIKDGDFQLKQVKSPLLDSKKVSNSESQNVKMPHKRHSFESFPKLTKAQSVIERGKNIKTDSGQIFEDNSNTNFTPIAACRNHLTAHVDIPGSSKKINIAISNWRNHLTIDIPNSSKEINIANSNYSAKKEQLVMNNGKYESLRCSSFDSPPSKSFKKSLNNTNLNCFSKITSTSNNIIPENVKSLNSNQKFKDSNIKQIKVAKVTNNLVIHNSFFNDNENLNKAPKQQNVKYEKQQLKNDNPAYISKNEPSSLFNSQRENMYIQSSYNKFNHNTAHQNSDSMSISKETRKSLLKLKNTLVEDLNGNNDSLKKKMDSLSKMEHMDMMLSLCSCYGKNSICKICLCRPSQSASRAGTPGFRPPEVLMKYTHQTTAVDIWAVGVIFLSFLSGRYPIFRASDDLTSLASMVCLYGTSALETIADKLGKNFVCSRRCKGLGLKEYCLKNKKKFPIEEIFKKTNRILKDKGKKITSENAELQENQLRKAEPNEHLNKSSSINNLEINKSECILTTESPKLLFMSLKETLSSINHSNSDQYSFTNILKNEEYREAPESAYDLLEKLLDLNSFTRISAEEALLHPFFHETF